ncbi:unnamed protein product [Heterobilharzia americana]|nr:unnamed protein product [Heterobilharzia americana]
MVLISGGQKFDCKKLSVNTFFEWFSSNPHIKCMAEDFRKKHPTEVHDSFTSVYVHQGEMATVPLKVTKGCATDRNLPEYLSSDDATSCYIVILRYATGCSIGHLDTPLRAKSFFSKSEQILLSESSDACIGVHIVGGFPDPQKLSESTLGEILSLLVRTNHTYDLRVCCIAENNIRIFNGIRLPLVMGVNYHIKTDQVDPARISWKARGPVPALRLSRLSSYSGEITNVFDPENCFLCVSPFAYVRLTSMNPEITYEEMRTKSTTPDQEPQTYFEGQAAVHHLMLHCYDSLSWFKAGPLIFRCTLDSNKPWIPVNEASAFASENPLTNVEI